MDSKENLQVMRCWLVAEWGKPQGNMSSVEIEKFTLEVENKVLKIPSPELIEKVRTMLVQDPVKFFRLTAWRWDHREIFMKEFGPWCTVGDALPLEACKHSVVETFEFIRNNPQELPQDLRDRGNSNDKYIKCVDKLQSIARMADFIRSRELLSIIVAESEQRGREKGCDKRRYSSEDGSHRAVALALAGHETVSAWVGNPLEGMVKE